MSEAAINSELMLFQLPQVQRGVEYTQWMDIRPINSITSNGSIDIQFKASGAQYIDLQRSRIYAKVKITKSDGSALTAKENNKVGLINNGLHSLFSQVDVYFQQKLVSTSGNNYPYKAMFDTLLNYSGESQSSQLQTQLFYKDTGTMSASNSNTGLSKRIELGQLSKAIDMEGAVYADVFQLSKYLLNEVDVRVKLYQSKPEFRLMNKDIIDTKTTYTVEVLDVKLKVAMVGISPEVLTSHAKLLADNPAIYPLTRTELKTFTVAQGQFNASLDDIFQGKIPNRLVVAMVKSEAYSGNTLNNPFKFDHFKFDFMCLYANGQSVPSKALQPDFDEGNYVECYQTLISGLGLEGVNAGLFCDRKEYASGYTIVIFDLASEVSEADVQAQDKKGNLQFEVRFKAALEQSINIILYASFSGEIHIDQARTVQLK